MIGVDIKPLPVDMKPTSIDTKPSNSFSIDVASPNVDVKLFVNSSSRTDFSTNPVLCDVDMDSVDVRPVINTTSFTSLIPKEATYTPWDSDDCCDDDHDSTSNVPVWVRLPLLRPRYKRRSFNKVATCYAHGEWL